MTSGNAKTDAAINRVFGLLQEWDKGNKTTRGRILEEFIANNQGKTAPELELEFAQAASLFLTRLTAWIRLTYMLGTCVNQQLQAIQIFLSAPSGHKYLGEFLEVGGVLTVLEILGLKQAKEADKAEALKLLQTICNAGRKYKELICESYGIRAVAECLARSKSEETQEQCRQLLQMLAQGNPKYEVQVYKGLIALLPASSPKAQQMAAQTLRIVQPIVAEANPNIVEPLLGLLRTLHLEVQYEAIELIKDLMSYEVQKLILKRLVELLKATLDETVRRPQILEDADVEKMSAPLPVFVQQAAAAKTIGVLCRESDETADKLIQMRVVHNLMVAMGNSAHADSQRQGSVTLEYLCRTFPIVNETCRDAMGENLYVMFMSNPDSLYSEMDAIQCDVLRSNKVNIPGLAEAAD
ncbi:armadillo-like helical domain containing protein 1 [Branchiostoma floridae]|uniref:Armadillo-like helical domain containing protein 1 n=1 Tax=Branchiostoma floridae TaxID=7739 RepID=A0A9J7MFR8_BRAFL|nr:armadillo-like helical domain containing protein 1 [Branchiostoma floridae]